MTKKRIPPLDLDPAVFRHRTGYNEADNGDQALHNAEVAWSALFNSMNDLFEREQIIRADKSRTREAQNALLTKATHNCMEPIAAKAQNALDTANAAIRGVNLDIENAMKSNLSPDERAEIRSYIRSLPEKEREALLNTADNDVLGAVLTGKPFLSGLSSSGAEMLRDRAEKQQFPELVQRREKLRKAVDLLHSGWESYNRNLKPLIDPNFAAIEGAARKAEAAANAPTSVGS